MKHIGIAAVTAEGAALVYKEICARATARLGQYQHPEISLHSFSFSEHVNAGEDRQRRWAELMTQSAGKLYASGVDFMICPSNTPHAIYERIANELPFPWLHIATGVLRMAEAARLNRLLLLGTSFTIESTIYDDQFAQSGISLVKPEKAEAKRIHDIITNELVFGRASNGSESFFSELLIKYKNAGVDGVILGCTELPIAISEEDSPLPVLDSATALADMAVEYSLKGVKA